MTYLVSANKGQAITQALDSRACPCAFDAVCQSGSTLILAHIVAKNAPEGEGRVTYTLDPSDEEKQSMPIGVRARLTYVSTAHDEDEECKYSLGSRSAHKYKGLDLDLQSNVFSLERYPPI